MMKGATPPEGFTERLYKVFLDSGLTFAEATRRSRVSNSALHSYIYYGRCPNALALARMCKLFNVSADYLLFGKE